MVIHPSLVVAQVHRRIAYSMVFMNWHHYLVIVYLCISISGAWSWSNSQAVSVSGHRKVTPPEHHLGSTTSRRRTSLSVLGFFQGKDEQGKDDSTDEMEVGSLSGISEVMNSMNRFKTSQRVSERTNVVIQELAGVTVEGTSADGKVKVMFNGQQRPVGVQIDEAYFQALGRKSGARELSVAINEAMKQAHEKSAAKMEEKLKALYSDLGFHAV